MFVADIRPEPRRGLGVGAEGVHVHLPRLGDEVVLLLPLEDIPPGPFMDQIRAPQVEVPAVQLIVAAFHPDLAHAEPEGENVQDLSISGDPDLGGVEIAFFMRPRLEAGHGHIDEKMFASQRVRIGYEPGRRFAFADGLPLRPRSDLGGDPQSIHAFDARRRHPYPRPAAREVGYGQRPFHIDRVRKVDPDVVGHGRHAGAGRAPYQPRREQEVAALALPHPSGAGYFQHDFVPARFENGIGEDRLIGSRGLVLAHLPAVDEGGCAEGDVVPPQHGHALSPGFGDIERALYPDVFDVRCSLRVPPRELARQSNLLPRERRLAFRRLRMFVALTRRKLPGAVQEHGLFAPSLVCEGG